MLRKLILVGYGIMGFYLPALLSWEKLTRHVRGSGLLLPLEALATLVKLAIVSIMSAVVSVVVVRHCLNWSKRRDVRVELFAVVLLVALAAWSIGYYRRTMGFSEGDGTLKDCGGYKSSVCIK